jgi:Zn-dependent protease
MDRCKAPESKRVLSLAVDGWGPWILLRRGPIVLRASLLLPPAALALAWLSPDAAARYALLLGALVAHELGHAIAALRLGARAVEVSIWPLFGRALLERLAGGREAAVAVAGPAVNLVLAGGLFTLGGRPDLGLRSAPLLDFLLTVNLGMGVGNLLPLAPADGGRALAALRR